MEAIKSKLAKKIMNDTKRTETRNPWSGETFIKTSDGKYYRSYPVKIQF